MAGFVLAVFVIAQLPLSRYTGKPAPFDVFMEKLGLSQINSGLVFLAGLLWVAVFTLLFGGLVKLIWNIIVSPLPTQDTIWDWRFALAKLTALTGVLAAVVALPFTLIRLKLTREQTENATESLYNEKMNNAVADLYSQRQVTEWKDGIASNGWQDDIPRRNGAIDRLKGLTDENPALRPRVDRLLSVYLRELSREYPPKKPPEDARPEALKEWADKLRPPRSDMENAAQTLSRLQRPPWRVGEERLPDLHGMNLQGFNLQALNFENANLSGARLQGAILVEARLQGAILFGARLQGAYLHEARLQGAILVEAQFDGETNLTAATLRGAAVRSVDFTKIPEIADHIDPLFGDATVTFPDGVSPPDRFNIEYETWDDFETAWRGFQRSIGQDPDNPE